MRADGGETETSRRGRWQPSRPLEPGHVISQATELSVSTETDSKRGMLRRGMRWEDAVRKRIGWQRIKMPRKKCEVKID